MYGNIIQGSILMADEVNRHKRSVKQSCQKYLDSYSRYLRQPHFEIIINAVSRYCLPDFSCRDITHSGMIGLVEAVHESKSASGWEFDELLKWYTSQNIMEYIAETNIILPEWETGLRRNIKTLKNDFRKRNDIEPSIFEITSLVNKSSDKRYSPRQIDRLIRLYEPSEQIIEGVKQIMQKYISMLNSAQRRVITKKFYEDSDHAVIAEELGIDIPRVEEIYKTAMNKLSEEIKMDMSEDSCLLAYYHVLFINKEL